MFAVLLLLVTTGFACNSHSDCGDGKYCAKGNYHPTGDPYQSCFAEHECATYGDGIGGVCPGTTPAPTAPTTTIPPVDCSVERGCGQCLNTRDSVCKWSDELKCSSQCPEEGECYHADFQGSSHEACQAYRKKTRKARNCRRKGNCTSCTKRGCNWAEGSCDLECNDRLGCTTDRNTCTEDKKCRNIVECQPVEKLCKAAEWVPDNSDPCKTGCGKWIGCGPDCVHEDRAYNGNGPEVIAHSAVECYEKCKAENTPEKTMCYFYTYDPSKSLGKRCKLFTKVSTTKKFLQAPGATSGNNKCHPEHGLQ